MSYTQRAAKPRRLGGVGLSGGLERWGTATGDADHRSLILLLLLSEPTLDLRAMANGECRHTYRRCPPVAWHERKRLLDGLTLPALGAPLRPRPDRNHPVNGAIFALRALRREAHQPPLALGFARSLAPKRSGQAEQCYLRRLESEVRPCISL